MSTNILAIILIIFISLMIQVITIVMIVRRVRKPKPEDTISQRFADIENRLEKIERTLNIG